MKKVGVIDYGTGNLGVLQPLSLLVLVFLLLERQRFFKH